VENYGVAVAEVARQVGISTFGVSKILSRTCLTSQQRPARPSCVDRDIFIALFRHIGL
jgi:hypothetical protein